MSVELRLLDLIKKGQFPQASVLVGNDLSKSYQVASMVQDAINKIGAYQAEAPKVDIIRDINKQAQALSAPFCFMIYKADEMTHQAQNALLKTFEEPPTNAFFVLVTDNVQGLLPTIISRAKVYHLEGEAVLEEDLKQKLQELSKKVIGNLAVVNPANLLRLTRHYEEEHVFHFIQCLEEEVGNNIHTFGIKTIRLLRTLSKARQQLSMKGVNRQSVVDMMLLDLKREVMRNATK